jgi:hypothetical protein
MGACIAVKGVAGAAWRAAVQMPRGAERTGLGRRDGQGLRLGVEGEAFCPCGFRRRSIGSGGCGRRLELVGGKELLAQDGRKHREIPARGFGVLGQCGGRGQYGGLLIVPWRVKETRISLGQDCD